MKKHAINGLLLIINVLVLLKRVIFTLFIVAWKPTRGVLRFVFYEFIVRGYSWYRTIASKLGWSGVRGNILSFLLNQKLVHFVVIFLTLYLSFINLSNKAKVNSITEQNSRPILADFVQSEFGQLEADASAGEIFEETKQNITQQKYKNSLSALSKPASVLVNQEEIDEESISTTHEGAALIKKDLASTQKTKQPRTGIIEYTVLPGDTISTIAAEYEISVNTVLWENNLSAYSLIRPGNILRILPFSGIVYTVEKNDTLSSIAKKYKVSETVISEANKMEGGLSLKIGKTLLIPGGAKTYYASAVSASYTGISAIKNLVKAPKSAPPASNKMNWPTQGYRITQYYSWRHTGLDVANKVGTPLYAADAGTVELAGWNSGYGNNIVINHGGGKKTRYAHLSKFYVKKGAVVGKGESIGAMGSTGWSTGSHLHFEVIINGTKYNPLNYIK